MPNKKQNNGKRRVKWTRVTEKFAVLFAADCLMPDPDRKHVEDLTFARLEAIDQAHEMMDHEDEFEEELPNYLRAVNEVSYDDDWTIFVFIEETLPSGQRVDICGGDLLNSSRILSEAVKASGVEAGRVEEVKVTIRAK